MEGFINLHRTLLDSMIFSSQTGLKIWIWLLLKASYRKRHVSLKIGKGETTVTIERGQLLFGRYKAEEELGIDGSTIYRWLKKLEERGVISGYQGSKPREVLMSKERWQELKMATTENTEE